MFSQINFNELMTNQKPITLTSNIRTDEITNQISKMFDYQFSGVIEEKIDVPVFPDSFDIGLICGSSGSGKSSILRSSFGDEELIKWDNNISIASHFCSFEEASNKFGAVGLNSIPTWLKPYRVLSNGEAFRANLARRLHNNAVIDEYTSVVNREVAISCSVSLEKYIRKNKLKNIVFASCHDDIIPYLRPDWIYNTDSRELIIGDCPRRPQITLQIVGATYKAWNLFKKYHYLSADINKAASCYMALYNDLPVAFIALLPFSPKGITHGYREHRLVVLPDYQGMGIGNKLSEYVGEAYIKKGCRYFCKTANPRIGEHRNRSILWRPTLYNGKARDDYIKNDGFINGYYGLNKDNVKFHALRVCYSHEYIGNGQKYPYTLREEVKPIGQQMTLFD